MPKRTSTSAANTPGFQFAKKRRVTADKNIVSDLNFDDVSKTPGLVVKRVTRSAAKAAAQAAAEKPRARGQRRAREPAQQQNREKPRRRSSKAAGAHDRPAGAVSIPAYPKFSMAAMDLSGQPRTANLVQKTVEKVFMNEMRVVNRAFRGSESSVLHGVMKSASDEFLGELDRITKHAVVGEQQRYTVLPNPKNEKLQQDRENLEQIVAKLRREDELWQQAQAQAGPAAGGAGEPATASDGADGAAEGSSAGVVGDEVAPLIPVPPAAEMESTIAFFAKQVHHMRNALQNVKQVTQSIAASHARMSKAVQGHTFKGYAHVNSPKKLVKGLLRGN
eukprot:g1145.t1